MARAPPPCERRDVPLHAERAGATPRAGIGARLGPVVEPHDVPRHGADRRADLDGVLVSALASDVVALFASPSAEADATTEFLRVLAALRAVDRGVRLLEVGRGVGVLSREDANLSNDGARYLAALREDGV